ncbi:hypothetical protein CBG46_00440 [Actinobacillus succinogenes]|uniref:Chalcone isomerase domain-containing protein n=1 Tax=Actinobacillus succinogenes (strain ATCC 55618 / DSM 22257 / CCUG 43843 / 130Z) TaxID=339671 RepID=A6VMX6_ACTSZ|nr:hypothetical protein [Actinobacillus succinogenes]ABR74323.1 conserved hypothetical protein [Actinobacillus succinogenes 130Z]PHI39253.1 hypothetical protein CBG46_00440 [Actinobacillus succinogenes]
MKLKSLFIAILCLIPTALSANWLQVGKADYNWGPFHVYTISVFTEDGQYKENQTPLMLSFDFGKPVEGKNFSIIMIKEMAALDVDPKQSETWLARLQNTLPDLSPNDRLNYIALPDTGYFVVNDQVLEQQFDQAFNQAFINIWLSGKTNFAALKDQLTGKEKSNATGIRHKVPPKVPMTEDDANPQIPPTYELRQKRIPEI